MFPWQAWSGRTADQATVETNLNNLADWLRQHGQPLQETLVVGDRAMLDAEIALLYDRSGLRHLTGLTAATPALKALITAWSDAQLEPLTLIETHCWDGSTLRRLAHVEPDLLALLQLVTVALAEMVQTAAPTPRPYQVLTAGEPALERLLPAPRRC
ncbi:MAG: hypothetical protein FJ011_12460 [Chloroflexi bacterium]|nr:hypothetical protein [Chloroflexota bacterium]